MKENSTISKTVIIVGAICLAFILAGVVFSLIAFNQDIYKSIYSKTNVYTKLGKQADNITTNVISYLQHKEDLHYFTQDEQSHMADVRNLIDKGYIMVIVAAALLCICVVLMYRFSKNPPVSLSSMLIWSGALTIILTTALVLLGTNFDWFFAQFHGAFFPQGNFAFPPSSLLITVFPQSFFRALAQLLGLTLILSGCALMMLGVILRNLLGHDRHAR